MQQLKDIARRMDNCHVRTAKRWWKKLGVPPDVKGHGPHRWRDRTADKLIKLWELYYATRGTTPQITRLKYAGKFEDEKQLPLNLNLNAIQETIAGKIEVAQKAVQKARRHA